MFGFITPYFLGSVAGERFSCISEFISYSPTIRANEFLRTKITLVIPSDFLPRSFKTRDSSWNSK